MWIAKLVTFTATLVVAQSHSRDTIGDQSAIDDQTFAGAELGIAVGLDGVAGIDCIAPSNCEVVPYDPVCGSDGVTYANDCEFVTQFCSTSRTPGTLFIQAVGECSPDPIKAKSEREVLPIDITPAPSTDNQPVPDTDLMTVFCSLTCKLTPDPVCGSDGVTYINDCHLLSSKCENPKLEKDSDGPCEKEEVILQVLEVNAGLSTPAPEKCNPMCDRVYDPVCGSDGITYANACLLEYAACRNPNVKAFGTGKCPLNMQAARASNPSGNVGGASCVPGPCPYMYAPVCGSDGQTHDNLCFFSNARCEHGLHALTILHEGECDADTVLTCETMTCPPFSECREQLEADGSVVAYCADVCSPDRCSDREDCKLVDSDCFTAPCSPIAMCVPKVVDQYD